MGARARACTPEFNCRSTLFNRFRCRPGGRHLHQIAARRRRTRQQATIQSSIRAGRNQAGARGIERRSVRAGEEKAVRLAAQAAIARAGRR